MKTCLSNQVPTFRSVCAMPIFRAFRKPRLLLGKAGVCAGWQSASTTVADREQARILAQVR